MEELHSTASLDQEIRDEARRNAELVLRKCAQEENSILTSVQERIELETKRLKKEIDEKISVYEKNVSASLPLEKDRFRIKFIYDSLIGKINGCLEALSEKQIVQLLTEMGKTKCKAFDNFKGLKVFAKTLNITDAQALEIAAGSFADGKNVEVTGQAKINKNEITEGLQINRGLILYTENNQVQVRLTLNEKIKSLLDQDSDKLVKALFGDNL